MHNYIQSTKNNVDFGPMFAPILMVLLPKFHQSIGATNMVAPIYWYNWASCTNRRRN